MYSLYSLLSIPPHWICIFFAVWSSFLMKFPSSSAYAQEDAPEAFEAFLNNGSAQNLLPAEPPQKSNYEDIILLVYYPVARLTLSEVGSAPFIRQLIAWLSRPNILTEIPEQSQFDLDLESGDPRTVNSTYDKCKIFYGCLYYVLTEALIQGRPSAEYPEGLYPFSMIDLQDCISTAYNYTLVCPILLYDVGALHEQEDPCISGGYECTIETWDAAGTDPNLQIFIQSGRDSEGLWWQGPKVVGERVYDNTSDTYITAWWPPESRSFSVALGRQALGYVGTECSLESPCLPDIDCKDTGSHIALGLGQGVYPEAWVECAIAAAKNINQQLSNQYVAIKGAAIVATLQTFRIQDFFPDPNKSFGLLNALQGLASAFAIIGGFVPGFSSKTLSLASTGVSAIGSFLGRYISDSAGPLIPQENYAENVATIYVSLVDGLDTAAELLFNGSSIDGGFNLTDMMKGGIWANVDSLERVSDIENQLRIEIISRSINALWKTPTSNKMFVLFVDLGDDDAATKCNADVSGPGDLRYCGDGGVYYTYNFIESGEGIGYLGWPWGADKLQAELRIDPAWITEASARTYRLANSTPGLDPFNFSPINGTAAFLSQSLSSNSQSLDLNNLAGRYPGSWTLPVCDAGTWGRSWNWNFINNTITNEIQQFPCLCGAKGLETAPWANASGLLNFETFYQTCKDQLTSKDYNFQWPEGITSVSFGFGAPIEKPGS